MPQTASELFTDRPVVMQNLLDHQFVPHKMKDACDVDDFSQNGCWIKKVFASEISKHGEKIAIVFTGLSSPVLCSSMKLILAFWASGTDVDSDRAFAGLRIVEDFIRVEKLAAVIQTYLHIRKVKQIILY